MIVLITSPTFVFEVNQFVLAYESCMHNVNANIIKSNVGHDGETFAVVC